MSEFFNYQVKLHVEELMERLEDEGYSPEEIEDWTEEKLRDEGRDFLESIISNNVASCYVTVSEDENDRY